MNRMGFYTCASYIYMIYIYKIYMFLSKFLHPAFPPTNHGVSLSVYLIYKSSFDFCISLSLILCHTLICLNKQKHTKSNRPGAINVVSNPQKNTHARSSSGLVPAASPRHGADGWQRNQVASWSRYLLYRYPHP